MKRKLMSSKNFVKILNTPPPNRRFPWHFLLAKKPVAIIQETKGCSQPRDGWQVGLYGIKKPFNEIPLHLRSCSNLKS
jgi:hypothetical protein